MRCFCASGVFRGHSTHQNVHLSIDNPDEFNQARYYAVTLGKPVGGVQLGLYGNSFLNVGLNGIFKNLTLSSGNVVTAAAGVLTATGIGTAGAGATLNLPGGIVAVVDASGNATITFPDGTVVTVSSSGALGLTLPPGSTSLLAKAVDTLGKVLTVQNNKVVFSVTNAIGVLTGLPNGGIQDVVNLTVDTSGNMQIGVKIGDAAPVVIPLTVQPGPSIISFVKDGGNDLVVDGTDPVVTYARIGHWGADRADGGVSGYQNGEYGTPRNTSADNFVDKDPERFYVRVIDPSANQNPNAKDTLVVKISTLLSSFGVDDALSEITLEETEINSGVFVSEAQLLVGADIPTESDAAYRVASKFAIFPQENARDDRTHRATVDGLVHVEYLANNQSYTTNIAVCNRPPDERKTLYVIVNIFNEPWQDINGNGQFDPGEPFVDISHGGVNAANFSSTNPENWGPIWTEEQVNIQMAALRSVLASAGIRVVEASPRHIVNPVGKLFVEDGNEQTAATIGRFDMGPDDVLPDTPVSRDHAIIQANFRSASQFNGNDSDDVIDIFFVPPFTAADNANGFQIRPGYVVNFTPNLATNLINSVFIGLDAATTNIPTTLAHEILHQLTNQGHSATSLPNHIIFPSGSGASSNDGSTVLWRRRIQQATATNARKERSASSMTDTGNRLLRGP